MEALHYRKESNTFEVHFVLVSFFGSLDPVSTSIKYPPSLYLPGFL